ncbi:MULTISPECIES: hypothetical protein [Streptomyces]|uniref:Uncharacterized protein n=1 Tax=Streptomyces nigrescens TaxID=1920 RepID=A0ABY7IUS1_STRNI|nr:MULTISPECIES: hypothetical protein [Streptomyces]WAU02090.1 hypothetical protein STRNI_000041 [Streptomyces nigrescens]
MPPRPRPAGLALEALTSGFEVSMHHLREQQTSAAVDTTVKVGGGAFVAVASLGLVLIYGPAAAPVAAVMAPLALVANRSYLRYRALRLR